MRYLIDTNILIRLRTEISFISKEVLQILEDLENRIYISTVSIQEIFMLLQAGKIHVPVWKQAQDVFEFIETNGISINYVKKEHLLTFAGLMPVSGHHDPFDRMIIAQALTEKIPLISSDAKFTAYRKQKLDFIFNEK
ncbi:MAG: type II toxin-antitoxin system VapC family toxin [Prevotellaceae bacterium]|jgi:PIN domain nuclease of toxin-antitoxin system|nr:type II toxin-antitoxin system VapC family toxin [Prevotellaceae bacterium]